MDREQGIHVEERAVLSPERWQIQYSTPEVKAVFLAQVVPLGYGLRCLASGLSASAAGAHAVPARPASLLGSAVVVR